MDKKTIIAVIGKTSSGKDTVAKVLNEKYGIPSVVSMTTRPKREYETNIYFKGRNEQCFKRKNNHSLYKK